MCDRLSYETYNSDRKDVCLSEYILYIIIYIMDTKAYERIKRLVPCSPTGTNA